MDPLSLTASLVAVGQAARTGLDTIKRIKAIWKAPAEIEDLRIKLQELDETLDDILSFIAESQGLAFGNSLAPPVARAKAIVARVNGLLQSKTLDCLRLGNANQARLNYMRNGSEAKALITDLQVVRMDLCVHFGLVTAFVSHFPTLYAISLSPRLDTHFDADPC